MESFWVAFHAVSPFLLYMAGGAFIRAMGWADAAFLNKLNTLVFRAFFPLLMFKNLYWVDPSFSLSAKFVLYAVGSVITVILLLMAVVPRLVKENARRGVIVQGIYRSNIVLFAIPLAESIYGSQSNILATTLVAFIVPIYNVSAVIILEYFRGAASSPIGLLKKICTNPLILGVATGAACFILHVPVPAFIASPVRTCADMATPLALISLGGTLRLVEVRQNLRILLRLFAVKMIALPIVSYLITLRIPFSPMERFMLLIVFATPTAVSSYSMAQNMGGDGPLAGQLVALTSAASLLTLFLFVFFLRQLGLLGV